MMQIWQSTRTLVVLLAALTFSALAQQRAAAVVLRQGDIVVSDATARALYRIDPVTGANTLITTGLKFPHGVTLDGNGQIIVVNDWFNGAGNIVRVDPDTGIQTVLFSAVESDHPWWGAVLPGGDILFTDYTNAIEGGSRLRRRNVQTGAVTTVSSAGLFRQTLNFAISGNTLYLTDHTGFASPILPRILKFDLTTNTQTVLSSGGSLVEPHGIAIDPSSGDLYVADENGDNGRILRVDPITGSQTVVTTGGLLMDPVDLTFDAQRKLLVADIRGANPSVVVRVDPLSGAQSLVTPAAFGQNFWGITVVAPEPACCTSLLLISAAVVSRRGR
jgi:DNA-binding beta-propeller fold protein YncE